MNLLDKTAAFFTSKKKQTSAEIYELYQEVAAAAEATAGKVQHLRNVERQHVLATGDSAAIAELDSKISALDNEEAALLLRRSRLHQDYKAAKVEEGLADAAANRGRISEVVGKIQTMQSQLDDARHNLKSQVTALTQLRAEAGNDARLDLPRELAQSVANITLTVDVRGRLEGERRRLVNELAPKRGPAKPKQQRYADGSSDLYGSVV